MPVAKKPYRVLLVCTGNICRSAMAEGLFKKLLAKKPGRPIAVSSAGIAAGDGRPPSDYAVEAALGDGVDIRSHRSRQFDQRVMDTADLVLVMASMHYSWILDMDPEYLHKTYLLRVFGRAKDVPTDRDIPDPFGGDFNVYKQTYNAIATEIRRIMPALKKLAAKAD